MKTVLLTPLLPPLSPNSHMQIMDKDRFAWLGIIQSFSFFSEIMQS